MYSSTHSSTSALDGSGWSASRHGRFILRERAAGNHWIGGWVGPRAGLETQTKNHEVPHVNLSLQFTVHKHLLISSDPKRL